MNKTINTLLIVVLCGLLIFPNLTPAMSSRDDEDNQKIDDLILQFDMSVPSYVDNGHIADSMKLLGEKLGDIMLPIDESVTDSVYTITDDVYDSSREVNSTEEDQENKHTFGHIVNAENLRVKSWEHLRRDYLEASVYEYVLDHRTVQYSINRYDFEIYNRLIWILENATLYPELIQQIEQTINYIIASEYKITFAALQDAQNLVERKPNKASQNRLRQAENHWRVAMDQLEKGNTRPAMNSMLHTNIRAQDVLELYGLEYSFETLVIDTDHDGLPDLYENHYGTDPYKDDTDGDSLHDLYEIEQTNTNPLKQDSDGNEVIDSVEDLDNDSLNNLDEFLNYTNPHNLDTDSDKLNDYDEIQIYQTNPTLYDTDGDSIGDGREIELGLNPLEVDSNFNGIQDNEERFKQHIPLDPEEMELFDDIGIVPNLTIHGPAIEQHHVTIKSAHFNFKHIESTLGIIGEAVDFESISPFDRATIQFKYNDEALQGALPENLRILWYDDDHHKFVLMPNQVLDLEESTITVETEHFSIYLLVDWSQWTNHWVSAYFEPGRPTSIRGKLDEILLATYYTDRDENFFTVGQVKMDQLKDIKNTIPSALVNSQNLQKVSDLDEAISTLKSLGTNKWKALIMPTDEETVIPGSEVASIIEIAKKHHIKVFTINTGKGNDQLLNKLASDTYGKSFNFAFNNKSDAITVLNSIYTEIKKEEDSDEDGIPDQVEDRGMRLPDGTITKTNTSLSDANNDGIADGYDSDLDGLSDGYEMGYENENGQPYEKAKLASMLIPENLTPVINSASTRDQVQISSAQSINKVEYHDNICYPWSNDSDQDGYIDSIDQDCYKPYISPVFLLHGINSNVKNVFGAYNYFADDKGNVRNKNFKSLDSDYYKISNQKFKSDQKGSFSRDIRKQIGNENFFLFNYAALGDYYLTSSSFNKYLKALYEAEELKSPIKNGVPEITVIAHSMGGLVTRSYIELSKDTDSKIYRDDPAVVKVKKLITLATPHWGGAHGAYAAPDDTGAVGMLNPNHCIFEHCSSNDYYKRDDDYYHGVSFKENINHSDNLTSYYAIIGGPISSIYEYESTGGRSYRIKKHPILSFIFDPKRNSDYEDQAIDHLKEVAKERYGINVQVSLDGSDGWVTINSGLGYKWKVWTSDYEMNMFIKRIYFGPTDEVDHSPIHHNKDVIKQTLQWLKY
jgi:pimeloyl-ACP methyl ester carboxylesterase